MAATATAAVTDSSGQRIASPKRSQGQQGAWAWCRNGRRIGRASQRRVANGGACRRAECGACNQRQARGSLALPNHHDDTLGNRQHRTKPPRHGQLATKCCPALDSRAMMRCSSRPLTANAAYRSRPVPAQTPFSSPPLRRCLATTQPRSRNTGSDTKKRSLNGMSVSVCATVTFVLNISSSFGSPLQSYWCSASFLPHPPPTVPRRKY